MNLEELIDPVVALATRAGEKILEVYATDFEVQEKDDASPVTRADLAADHEIVAGLAAMTPEVPILSEESGLPPFEERSAWTRYWLVDPLDGTKEFVNRNGEFTVNIALIDDGRPVFGVVRVPVQAKTYVGCEGYGADVREDGGEPRAIHVGNASAEPPRVVGSRSHRGESLDKWLANLGDFELVPMGSSLKFCVVAEGGADVYPRLGPTSEWDTAAAHAVVLASGGIIVTLDGEALQYNKKESLLNPEFLVIADDRYDWLAAF